MTDDLPPIGTIERDEWHVRAALRRLNPEFHEHDSSWPALDRIMAELGRLRGTTAFWREIEDRLRVHSEMPAAPTRGGDGRKEES